MSVYKKCLLLLVFSLSFVHFSSGQQKQLLQIFPLSTPEAQGVSSAVLDSLIQFIKSTKQNIHHLTIIRNNKTVLDTDIYPYASRFPHDMASVTKSFTSLLIGIAIDKAFIKDENETVLKYFPEVHAKNNLLNALTIKHLLTMTSGFDCSASDGERALREMRSHPDWVKFVFDLPMIAKPGEKYSYCSCNYYILGEIISRTTTLTPHEFAKKYVFNPLQISGSKWLANEKGMNHGWGDLILYPVDMAKIGKLMLDHGKWRNEQIVSEAWIRKSVQRTVKLSDEKGYGYGWWTNDKVGYYEAAGRGKQTISVLPSQDMIVTMAGGEFDGERVGGYILRSIQSDKPLSARQKDIDKLNRSLKEIAVQPLFRKATRHDTLIRKLHERTISFEKNIAEIDSLKLRFISTESGTVTFYRNQSVQTYPFLLSRNSYALGIDTSLNLQVAAKANCEKEDEFVLHFNQLCRINNFHFRFKVTGDSIVTTMHESSNFLNISIPSFFSTQRHKDTK